MKRTPLTRKPKKVIPASRQRLPRCSVQRCTKIARIKGFCPSHALQEADRRFSLIVRSTGVCAAQGTLGGVSCNGGLQCAHLISRRYRAVRWWEQNAVALCAAHHKFGTEHPLEWDAWVSDLRGPITWASMKRSAIRDRGPNLTDVLERLPA